MKEKIIIDTIRLRHELHKIPEASLSEFRTKKMLLEYVNKLPQIEVTDCGSWFYACRKGIRDDIPGIALRADMDAVTSGDGKAGHFCGHDGHSAILAGFGRYLSEAPAPERSIYLIFQPAEETGQGALICRNLLKEKNVSEIYAFHNVPGYETGTVLLREGTFACASTGMEIVITGAPSHAAYPEAGKNPAGIIAELILLKDEIMSCAHKGMILCTVIGADIGSSSYGVSAGRGILRLTLRAEDPDEFKMLISEFASAARAASEKHGMACDIRLIEEFPATVSDSSCLGRVSSAAKKSNKKILRPVEPFRWSEDFGHYLFESPGAIFGVGAGISCPQLHTDSYEFPDEICGTVLDIYAELIRPREPSA